VSAVASGDFAKSATIRNAITPLTAGTGKISFRNWLLPALNRHHNVTWFSKQAVCMTTDPITQCRYRQSTK